MKAELAHKVLTEVRRKFPALNLTAEDIVQITIITLSTLAASLRRRTIFSSARLLKYAGNSVKSLFEAEKRKEKYQKETMPEIENK